jgi:hypothetical protein
MVDEAPTDDTQTEGNPMTTTKPEKKKRAKKRTKKTPEVKEKRAKVWGAGRQRRGAKLKDKSKANGKPELTDKGLPVRPKYDEQLGIRVSADERAELIERCRKDGQFSLSNLIRAALKLPPLR